MYSKLKTVILCLLFVFIGSLSFSFDSLAYTDVTLPSFSNAHPESVLILDQSFIQDNRTNSVHTYYYTGNAVAVFRLSTSNVEGYNQLDRKYLDAYLSATPSDPNFTPYSIGNGRTMNLFNKRYFITFLPSSGAYTIDDISSNMILWNNGQYHTYISEDAVKTRNLRPYLGVLFHFQYSNVDYTSGLGEYINTASYAITWNPNNIHLYYQWVYDVHGYSSSQDIKDQTNSLQYNYDSSKTSNDNTNLNNHLDQIDQAENQLTSTGFTNIDNVQMVDIGSSSAMMLTALSFCTSFLQSLFVNLGVFNYWVLISLSMTIALVLIGWMRYK